MADDKYIKLAKKLKELADRGVGGEQTNADEMLQTLMKKHGISLEALSYEEEAQFFFTCDSTYETDLLHQICFNVVDEPKMHGPCSPEDMKEYELGGNIIVTCTHYEYLEIEAKFEFFKMHFFKDLEIFFTAFVLKNGLVAKAKSDKSHLITEGDIEEASKMYKMSQAIDRRYFNTQINK
jgi:hypothetical protein